MENRDMEEIIIDCSRIDSPREFHRVLAEKLNFPGYYGGNLDALYDCLTQLCSFTKLRLVDFDKLPTFSRGFRRVMENAQEDNPCLRIYFS